MDDIGYDEGLVVDLPSRPVLVVASGYDRRQVDHVIGADRHVLRGGRQGSQLDQDDEGQATGRVACLSVLPVKVHDALPERSKLHGKGDKCVACRCFVVFYNR